MISQYGIMVDGYWWRWGAASDATLLTGVHLYELISTAAVNGKMELELVNFSVTVNLWSYSCGSKEPVMVLKVHIYSSRCRHQMTTKSQTPPSLSPVDP